MGTFTYDTYGKLLRRTGRFKPIFLYNGRDGVVTDPNGLLYMRARYYSPELRRFMNADLLAGDISDARTLNRYAYVCGDPVSFVDPFGLAAERGGLNTSKSNNNNAIVFENEFTIDSDEQFYCDCVYDGSVCDFKRLERGLPPRGCTHCIDITEKLNAAMKENAELLTQYSQNHSFFETLEFFVNKVKPGGDWDFKSQEEWNLKSGYTYFYEGKALRFDDIGNLHYGYIGGIIFSEEILKIAGGLVQLYTKSSSWDYRDSYWDDPRDQEMITYGYSLLKNNGD